MPSQARKPIVLVVDDDPFNVAGLNGLLSGLQITEVHSAYDGQQALESLQRLEYRVDVVITDFQMPVMNGVRLAQEIRQLQEEGDVSPELRIVIASGMNLNNDFNIYNIGGRSRPLFDYKMQKPFSSKQLRALFEKLQSR